MNGVHARYQNVEWSTVILPWWRNRLAVVIEPVGYFLPGEVFRRHVAGIESDSAVYVHDKQSLGIGAIKFLHLALLVVEQASHPQTEILQSGTNALLQEGLRTLGRVGRIGKLVQCFGQLMIETLLHFLVVDEEKFSPVAIFLDQFGQVNHLRTEGVSVEVAKDQYDRLVSTKVSEANRAVLIQRRQTEIRSHASHASITDFSGVILGLLPLVDSNIDPGRRQRA